MLVEFKISYSLYSYSFHFEEMDESYVRCECLCVFFGVCGVCAYLIMFIECVCVFGWMADWCMCKVVC